MLSERIITNNKTQKPKTEFWARWCMLLIPVLRGTDEQAQDPLSHARAHVRTHVNTHTHTCIHTVHTHIHNHMHNHPNPRSCIVLFCRFYVLLFKLFVVLCWVPFCLLQDSEHTKQPLSHGLSERLSVICCYVTLLLSSSLHFFQEAKKQNEKLLCEIIWWGKAARRGALTEREMRNKLVLSEIAQQRDEVAQQFKRHLLLI